MIHRLRSLEQVTDWKTLTPCPFFDSISFNRPTWNSQIAALRTAKIRWSDSQPFPSALNSNGHYLITCPIVDLHIIITHLSPKIVASPLVQPASHLIMITRHDSEINLILIYLSSFLIIPYFHKGTNQKFLLMTLVNGLLSVMVTLDFIHFMRIFSWIYIPRVLYQLIQWPIEMYQSSVSFSVADPFLSPVIDTGASWLVFNKALLITINHILVAISNNF